MENNRKSEIMLDLLKELMTEMKGSAGKRLKPVASVEAISVMPKSDEEVGEEAEMPEVEEMDEECSDDLGEVLDAAAEDEPTSPASKRLALRASLNKSR